MKQRLGLLLCALATSAHAGPALDAQTFYSSDGAGFDTFKQLAGLDFQYRDPEHYLGIAAQRARYEGPGFEAGYNRVYFNYADSRDRGDGTSWKWNTLLGSDGHTWLGNAEIFRERADGSRDDLFLERDIVETREGTRRGIYYTLLGVAEDFTLDSRWSATGVVAVQDFTGENTRTLFKGRLGYVLSEDWGLSAQLRTRWFRDSHPYEYDYFSPRWYGEWIPTLQLRRFYGGNQFRIAVGYGRQRASDRDWQPTKLAEIGWTSPKRGAWYAKINAGYTNTPVNTSYAYSYRYVNAQFVLPFR
jgi:hypothetical protein